MNQEIREGTRVNYNDLSAGWLVGTIAHIQGSFQSGGMSDGVTVVFDNGTDQAFPMPLLRTAIQQGHFIVLDTHETSSRARIMAVAAELAAMGGPDLITPRRIQEPSIFTQSDSHTIKEICPECGQKYDLSDELIGQKVQCAACNTKWVIQAPQVNPTGSFFQGDTKVYQCPHCAKPMKVPSESIGGTVICPYTDCSREFSIPMSNPIGRVCESSFQVSPSSSELKAGVDSHGIEFVWCPPGTFMMGSPVNEKGRMDWEIQRQVTLTRGFWIGKHPVTLAEWLSFMGYAPQYNRALFGDYNEPNAPVMFVSWEEAMKFCRNLGLRLPTSAEWEYACRAGSTMRFCFGDDEAELGRYAWFKDNSGGEPHPVGEKMPNAWGIHDMHGNVAEWCADWSGDYRVEPVIDPSGPPTGSTKLFRGTGWDGDTDGCRSAQRNGLPPEHGYIGIGFRVASDMI